MKVYIDYVFFINFMFDALLLLCTSILLKRGASVKRIILGSLVGSITILVLFINISNTLLFLLKIILSIIIILITFGYKDIKYFLNNIFYFYINSIVLGGFLYFLNIQISYNHTGLIFYKNNVEINILFILIATPIILYIYIKSLKKLKYFYNSTYKVKLIINKKEYLLNGYLDTGNNLKDPYNFRPIIIIYNKELNELEIPYVLVPYKAVNYEGMIKCIKPTKIFINDKELKQKILVGLMESNFNIEGINCILNNNLKEELC